MMGVKTKATGLNYGGVVGASESGAEWEVRPGGMLVQKRNSNSNRGSDPAKMIRVRVKYGSTYSEININSQATFGDLKKMLTGPTGLHHQDQKLIYKKKERDSKAFLDITGIKDKSKIVLVEDPLSQERRFLELRRNAKMEKASKSISDISLVVDRLGGQVSALDLVISKGWRVEEKQVLSLIEELMNQLLKLDGIIADGDVKLQQKMQVQRVQKYVEILDMLKIKNSMANQTGDNPATESQRRHSNGQRLAPIQEEQSTSYNRHQLQTQQHQQQRSSGKVVVTTQWETFDSTPSRVTPTTSTSTSTTNNSAHQPKFPWDFFN